MRGFGIDLFPGWYYTVMFASGLMWMTGFSLFCIAYWPILTGPDARRA